jgi:2-polyprenyl-3-methyl-5-hydroxy-6-metoxy-1,4-benzoquinol methylase
VVERAARLLGGYPRLLQRNPKPIWVDVGCGTGALVMAANDHGFATGGVDTDGEAIAGVLSLGFGAVQRDFMQLPFELVPDVLSLMQVLAAMPDPRGALTKAAQILKSGGLLILSTPDSSSSSWMLLERDRINPHWSNPQLHHVFSRDRLIALLQEIGFEIADIVAPNAGQGLLELYAVRK